MAARKIGGGGFEAAKSQLEEKLAASPTAATNDEIANLASIRIDAEEKVPNKAPMCIRRGSCHEM